jgi:hypothetical protein
MSDLHEVLERFAQAGEERGATSVFAAATTTVAYRRKRRRFRVATAIVLALAVVVSGVVATLTTRTHERVEVVTTPSTPKSGVPAAVTAQQLIGGHWEAIPPAPIVIRASPSVVWTGKEMVVWGGASGARQDVLRADGAAFDPRSRTWRRLPPAPLTARLYHAAVWTGTEMVIWGGYTNATGSITINDGAAYNPATNRWRTLPASPLRPQANAIAVWNGHRVVIFGSTLSDAAAYDPSTNQWRVLAQPTPPSGASVGWTYAVRIDDGRLLVWSHSDTTKPVGANTLLLPGATVMFLYDGATDHWQRIPTTANAIPNIFEAFWTGTRLLVRGDMRGCFICNGPVMPEVTGWYDPATNTWSRLPEDPLAPGPIGGNGFGSVWTGAALWSFNPRASRGGPGYELEPGDTSVYDPITGRWTRLTRAQSGCQHIVHPIWTGNEVLIYCPSTYASGIGYASAP